MPEQEPFVFSDDVKVTGDTRWWRRNEVTPGATPENLLINGGFEFAQRQAPGTLTTVAATSARTYSADRWWAYQTAAGYQYQRIDTASSPETGLQAEYYGKFKRITALGKIIVGQVIEGKNTLAVRGRTVRFSIKMRYTVAASMTVRLALGYIPTGGTIDTVSSAIASTMNASGTDPTFAATVSFVAPVDSVNGSIVGNGVTCVLAGAWVKYSATFVVPSNCKNLIPMLWTDATMAINDELNLAEADFRDGPDQRDWYPRQFSTELQLCQRYYQKSFSLETAPAQSIGVNTGEARWLAGIAGANIERSPQFLLPTPMRVLPPTRTTYNPAAGNIQARDTTAVADCSAIGLTMNFESSFYIIATGAAGTAVGNHIAVHWTLDAEL